MSTLEQLEDALRKERSLPRAIKSALGVDLVSHTIVGTDITELSVHINGNIVKLTGGSTDEVFQKLINVVQSANAKEEDDDKKNRKPTRKGKSAG